MYRDIWNFLPGAWWVKVVVFAVAIIATVVLLLEVVVPALAPHMPGSEATMGGAGQTGMHTSQVDAPSDEPEAATLTYTNAQ